MSAQNVESLVTYLVTSLVDNPDDVKITLEEEDRKVTILITVNTDDIGKVIGRSGRTIKSIRTLASAAGGDDGIHYYVDVEG